MLYLVHPAHSVSSFSRLTKTRHFNGETPINCDMGGAHFQCSVCQNANASSAKQEELVGTAHQASKVRSQASTRECITDSSYTFGWNSDPGIIKVHSIVYNHLHEPEDHNASSFTWVPEIRLPEVLDWAGFLTLRTTRSKNCPTVRLSLSLSRSLLHSDRN